MSKLDRRELSTVFLGGAAGSCLRVGLSRAFPDPAGDWPWVIFAINVSGAFLLGYLLTSLLRRPRGKYTRTLIGTGFCGAYTTFSTMQLELLEMLDRHRYGLALGYAAASIGAGYVAVYVATLLARRGRMLV